MPRDFIGKRAAVVAGCTMLGLAIAIALPVRGRSSRLLITVDHPVLPANGFAVASIHVRTSRGRRLKGVTWRLENGQRLAELSAAEDQARVRAGVTPGTITISAAAPGFPVARENLTLALDPTDAFGDGTPDFLRLDGETDRIAFRRWFTFLAESTYVQPEGDRPAEISDCAALIRFAYREALRRHDAAWANQWHLATLPEISSVQKYDYPHTALGAALFRVAPGAFAPDDLTNRAFAEFADADSMRRYNTYFVSRDWHAAEPGDLFFFRQEEHRMPFHSMIYLGASNFGEPGEWLIYHTGPGDGGAGEIRRVTVNELLGHPQFCWRPLPQNPAFLGVYRWNILREEE